MKTIKQIADELGVSKQAIAKKVAKLPPTEVTTNEHGAKLITPKGKALLQEPPTNRQPTKAANQPPTVGGEVAALISMLQSELDVKNKLIDEQQQTINKLSDALTVANQSAQMAQTLHAGTMQKQLEAAATDPPAGGFFARIFGTKK